MYVRWWLGIKCWYCRDSYRVIFTCKASFRTKSRNPYIFVIDIAFTYLRFLAIVNNFQISPLWKLQPLSYDNPSFSVNRHFFHMSNFICLKAILVYPDFHLLWFSHKIDILIFTCSLYAKETQFKSAIFVNWDVLFPVVVKEIRRETLEN